MPKRTDISSILIVGAGPIVIGQASEFDYSGVQACKALRAEGYRVVLVNSNPATIMTDPDMADATYIEPIEPATLERVIARERPDALLPTMGGQTALNAAMTLAHTGILERYGVALIGASAEAIDKAEDRLRFRDAMAAIGLDCPRSALVSSKAEAGAVLEAIGLPAILRPSFTLGGAGGGTARTVAEYEDLIAGGLAASPIGQVLVEESLLGWKEFEMEVVRDRADNCIIVCSIENVDPMGVHTGDSITVAPALTLTDKEYQRMRNASFAVLREIGVETGGANVQFAIEPETGRMVVIEMNPRVSRSSALASKATGFPIAKVAARLAVGYTLDELTNDITGTTPAAFEPAIDYVVTKIPRFTFEKFPASEPLLSTSMKSVGEAMAIGRTFAESLQKGLRSVETGLTGLNPVEIAGAHAGNAEAAAALTAALAQFRPDRILVVAEALRAGMSVDAVHAACRYDPWFIERIQELIAVEREVAAGGLPDDAPGMLRLKQLGFSDERLGELANLPPAAVTAARRRAGVAPVYKRVDTCAAEFPALTSYMYSTYEGDGGEAAECESRPTERDKVVILGGGPNRIGQGIEFDYCCVHAAYALKAAGIETIMVNCNPETVSTDYDTSDRLYFEPLTAEDVIALIEVERTRGKLLGVIAQFGGQTPLRLVHALERAGIPILGTPPDAIDLAEDRGRFQSLIETLGLKQPASAAARTTEEAAMRAAAIGYPVVIRPSYVLGGRAMQIVYDEEALRQFTAAAMKAAGHNPILIDDFLEDATEVDVDAVADGEDVFVAGVMQHIEEAGIHSGDSACSLPPHSLAPDVVVDIRRQTEVLARGLGVIGLMNVQFAIKDGDIYVLEVNPRASRTVPFVAKATGIPLAKIAARVMIGERLADFHLETVAPSGRIAVKEAVLPFARFPGSDTILGPEMKSTGEVMGIDSDFGRAFAKSQIGAGWPLPTSGTVFVSVKDRDKDAAARLASRLAALGFSLLATTGTARHLARAGLAVAPVNKVSEGSPHCVDALEDGRVRLVINTTEGAQAIVDSFSIRRTALHKSVPYYTTIAGAEALLAALEALDLADLELAPLQDYPWQSF